MDQESMGSSTKPPIPQWLLVTLAIVVVAALGLGGWYFLGGEGKTTVKTSPTPTLSVALSPSAGATSPSGAKTATPSGGQTATATATPTSTPTPTPPAGWKLEKNEILQGGGNVVYASYQLFIKDSWSARPDSAFVIWPNNKQYYGDDPHCGTSVNDPSYSGNYCYFYIHGGGKYDAASSYFYPIPNSSKYLIVTFNEAKPLSESDKKIILDSVQVIEGH